MTNLDQLADAHLTAARAAENGRSTEIVLHDGPLRQTVIAIKTGVELGEHNSPPAASVHVLRGRVVITGMEGDEEIGAGELRVLAHHRHAVRALEDAAFLLTTVTSIDEESHR
ncbi:cupin domain-containing protein [Puerhibacterium puerhi]|uniref:cupin n=1 Tax=Puerhibacterium puerhi TaxID=2692623 RepID=UPI00135C7652|nr:cupin [Puerhibacterium puerhi]